MKTVVQGFIVASIISAGLVASVGAQGTAATPTVPAGAECTIAPIAFERLSSLSATPAADPTAADAASPVAGGLPAGEPADAETTRAVQAVVIQLIACINAGDSLRSLALYSDGFIALTFTGLNITQVMYDAEITNLHPRAAGKEVVLYSISEVVLLTDGRAAVVVVGDDLTSPDPSKGTLFYLVNVDGEWLIDKTVESILQGD